MQRRCQYWNNFNTLFKKSYLSDSNFRNTIFVFQSTYIILFQWIAGGLLGDGVDVLSPVDMESNMELGGESVVDVLRKVEAEENHVLLEDLVEV